ncbi:T9SS type A sorting domain-containing protein [Arcicella sp. DC2W]|uniref:T9SS type A sorting domain-containing protein n=1 Tax=Arcicella gelida TaxID=2984195 RepID=A0ABU5S114_9BACT|nr:T9SS type A sorting domain-containing protein [Arcicella sp. DC2W]MEA5402166.1 T9SS type A sorting domain-containing protein [Arcicella sp. DC2W]
MKHFYSLLVTTLFCINYATFSQQVSSNSPVCLGNPLELKASGGKTFVWKGPNGFTSTQQNPSIEKTISENAGSYSVTIDGTTTLSVDVKVGKTYFGKQVVYNSVSGNILYLSTYPSAANDLAFRYSWSGPNNFTSQDAFSSIKGFDKKAQGKYTVTMTDEFGCISEESTVVALNTPDCPYSVRLYVEAGDNSTYYNYYNEDEISSVKICKGTSTTLRVDTSYFGKCKVQWYKSNQLLTGENGVKLQIKEDAVYYAKITNSTCEYQSAKLEILSKTSPNISIYSYGGDESQIAICNIEGQVTLGVSLEYLSVDNYSYQWLKNDKIIEGATSYSYLAEEVGEYKVIGKTGLCAAVSSPIKIISTDKISAKLSFFANSYDSSSRVTSDISKIRELKVCTNTPINFNLLVQAIGNQEIYLNGKLQSSNSNVFTATQSGTYKLKVKQGQCLAEDSLKITIGKSFTIPLIHEATLPFYYGTTLANTYYYPDYNYSNALSYNNFKWYKDDKLYSEQSTFTPIIAGNYQLKYLDNQTDCIGESRIIKIDKPFVAPKFTIKSQKITVLCEGNSLTLNPNICYNNDIIWKKDGKKIPKLHDGCDITVNEVGKYWYEFSSGTSTYYSDTIEIKTEKKINISVKDSCLASNTFTLITNAIPDGKYQWYQDKELIKGATNNSFNTTQYGNYYVQVVKNNCVNLSKEISIGISIPSTQNICRNDSIIFTPKGTLKTVEWTGPNNFNAKIINPKIPKSTTAMSGIYTIKGETSSGCVISTQSRVIVNDLPTMNLQKTIIACEGSDFEFPRPTSILTDSTETADYFTITYPNGTQFKIESYSSALLPVFKNISSKNAGTYKVEGFSNKGGCSVTGTTQLSVVNSAECRSITLGNLNPSYLKPGVCVNTEIEIPFTTTGTFPVGTKFKVITTENIILGEGTKSPIKVKVPQTFYSFEIRVVSEDKTVSSLKSRINLKSHWLDYEFISDRLYSANDYSMSDIIACDSAHILSLFNSKLTNFQWFRNNIKIPNVNTYNIQAKQSGSYTLKFETEYGCIWETKPIKVTLGQFPKPIISGRNELLCGEETASININSSAGNIIWKRDGIILAGKNASTLNVNQVGKYVATIQNNQCLAISSDTLEITQSTSNKLKTKIVYSYWTVGCSEFKADLYAKSGYSSKKLNYQWFKNGIEIPDNNDSLLIVTEKGKYSVKISNGTCEGFSEEVILDRPSIQKIFYYYNNANVNIEKEVCEGSNIILNLNNYLPTSISNEFTKDSSKTNYNLVRNTIFWYRDGKQINEIEYPSKQGSVYTEKDADKIYFYSENGKRINDASISSKTSGKYFTVIKALYENGEECVSSTDTVDIKFSKRIQLVNDYSYDKNLKYIPIASCQDSVTIRGNSNSISANSYEGPVNNQRAIGYTWKKDGQIFKPLNNQESTQSITTNQEGTYVLETQYKGGCVSLSQPYKISLGKLVVSISSSQPTYDYNICEGDKIIFNGIASTSIIDTNKIVYKWLKDGTSLSNLSYITTSKAGAYQLKASQGKCEGTSETIKVNFVKIPTSISPKDSITFCDNATVELIASNETGLKYQWELNNTSIKDANASTFKTNNSGIYRALLRKGECWDYSEKVKTIALPTILPKATLTGDQSIDYDKETKISVSLNSYAPWTLTFSDGQIFTATTSPFEVSVKPLSTTTYALSEVKNICGIGTTEGSAKIEVIILANDIEKDIKVEVYPIPTSETCNWKISTDKPEKVYLTLYDVSGKNILEQTSENRSQSHSGVIDLSKINAGTYFLKIDVGNKNITRKIIKY